MFYKRLLPLMEFEREIPTIDLSKVVLTHHILRNKGQATLHLEDGEAVPIPGLAPGGGSVQEKEKALLSAIIAKAERPIYRRTQRRRQGGVRRHRYPQQITGVKNSAAASIQ
jgi:hypothetical protein